MSERLIDSVCPHCGRPGTTVRVVKHEDGFTKLSRLCKECGGEWIHTFDADWLAVAKTRRLEAEVERLRAERDTLLLDARDFVRWFNRNHPDPTSNPDHPWCALNDRLNAHADVLATFDSGVETKEAKS